MNERWTPSPEDALIDCWIDVEPQLDTVKLIPVGELDIATVGELRTQLDDVIEAGFGRVVIDLRRLEFIDSTGLHALLLAHARANDDGWQLAIVPGRHAVHRLFEITGTVEQLPFTPTTTSAGSSASRLHYRPDGVELDPGAWSRPLDDPTLQRYPRAR